MQKLDLNPFVVSDHKNITTLDNAIELSNFYKKKPIIIKYAEDSFDNFCKQTFCY